MDINLSDTILENLDSFAEFVMENFQLNFPRTDAMILSKGRITSSPSFSNDFMTIDYSWTTFSGETYSTTHAYLYLREKKLYLLQHGMEKEQNRIHYEYIKDNISILEREYNIDKILNKTR